MSGFRSRYASHPSRDRQGAIRVNPVSCVDRFLTVAARMSLALPVVVFAACCGIATGSAAEPPLAIRNVFLRLTEDLDLPAREAGVLAEMPAEEGTLVEPGMPLARVEDAEAKLFRDRTALEVEVARREADRSIEAEYAQKALGVAQAELARSERSRAAVAGAVSLTEIDRLRLETEKADAEIRRIEYEGETALVSIRLKESELALAELRLARHRIDAPIAGQVVERYRSRGEWVEPGEKVLRLIRLDRLRAEGYVEASRATAGLVGTSVAFRSGDVTYPGKVMFVAPEVEPTSGQILIRAEIENPKLLLRPGLRGEMTVGLPAASVKESVEPAAEK